MNISHLVKYELKNIRWIILMVWGFFALNTILSLSLLRTDTMMFSMSKTYVLLGDPTITATFASLLFLGCFREILIHKQPSFLNAADFIFTRPIRKKTLFLIKFMLFFCILLPPPLIALGYSYYSTPEVRIELPYRTAERREQTKHFYLTNFPGSYLEQPDDGKNQNYIHIPHGKAKMSVYSLVYTWLLALLLFSAVFIFNIRSFTFLFIGFMFGFGLSFSVIDLLSLQLKFKFSYFECTVVWLNQNLTLTFLVLSALTAIVYHFSAKKFIHAEVR